MAITEPPRWLTTLLFLLSLSYTALYLPFREQMQIPLGILLLLGAYTYIRYYRYLLKTPLHYFFWAAAIIPVVSWLLVKWQIPEESLSSPRSEDLANKFIFLVPALILAGNIKKTFLFWFVAALSAFSLPWLAGKGFTDLEYALNGKRTGFGRHMITMGIIYATLLIAAFVFLKRFVISAGNQPWRWILWAGWVLASTVGVIGSQTRAVYAGLAIVAVIATPICLVLLVRYFKDIKKIAVYGIPVLLITITSQVFLYQSGFHDGLISKTKNEMQVMQKVTKGDFESISKNSSGLRIHFWKDAIALIEERPITGWGIGANNRMHERAGNRFQNRYFITVHNDLLEISLAHGLIGVGFLALFLIWITYKLISLVRIGTLPEDIVLFSLLFAIFFAFNGLFLSTLYFRDTIFLWNVVFAGLTGFIIKGYTESYGGRDTA